MFGDALKLMTREELTVEHVKLCKISEALHNQFLSRQNTTDLFIGEQDQKRKLLGKIAGVKRRLQAVELEIYIRQTRN